MSGVEIDYVTPVSKRQWKTRDVVTGAASLAAGMTACVMHAGTNALESALARQWSGDYVAAAQAAFWMATVPGGILGLAALFLGVSVMARGAESFGLAKMGALAGFGGLAFAAMRIANG